LCVRHYLICLQLERDYKFHKVLQNVYIERKLELLMALRKLRDNLSAEEDMFIKNNTTESMANFETASNELSKYIEDHF
jgi:hypothetical protein